MRRALASSGPSGCGEVADVFEDDKPGPGDGRGAGEAVPFISTEHLTRPG
jgi:hypothetical protein